jgi:hypothetical protein
MGAGFTSASCLDGDRGELETIIKTPTGRKTIWIHEGLEDEVRRPWEQMVTELG